MVALTLIDVNEYVDNQNILYTTHKIQIIEYYYGAADKKLQFNLINSPFKFILQLFRK